MRQPPPGGNRRRFPRALMVLLAAAGVLLAAGGGWLWWQLQPVSDTSRPVELEVLPGWGASRIAAELKEQGLIRNARVFVQYVRFSELDRRLGEGLYDLDASFSVTETAAVLASPGRPRIVRIVIPEGFRATAVIDRLTANDLSSEAEYAELVPGLLEEYGWLADGAPEPDADRPFQPLEGFLFPASYDMPVRSTPEEVLRQFLERFEQEFAGTWVEDRLGELGLGVRDWVVLASLVQAEAGNDAEMPVIAGVFLNRLDDDMPLQSDPTVAYGLDKALPELDVQAGDMQDGHEWNTYVHPGVPPTPIGNPGHAALQAVLKADRVNEDGVPWLYFLHGSHEGEAVFRPNTDYGQHLEDIETFLR